MNQAVTIDASVFVSAFSPTEPDSERSWRFLIETRAREIPVIVPTLVLAEGVASLARKQNNADMALNWMREIQRLSNITFISLDERLAQEAAEIAARHRLRGSDAIYAAVARRFAATLITLDVEQGERAAAVVSVRQPDMPHD